MYYYRDKEFNEINMVFESGGERHQLEIKKSNNSGTELVGAFKVLDKASIHRGTGAIVCLLEEFAAIDRQHLILPV